MHKFWHFNHIVHDGLDVLHHSLDVLHHYNIKLLPGIGFNNYLGDSECHGLLNHKILNV